MKLAEPSDMPDNCPFWDRSVSLVGVEGSKLQSSMTVAGKDATLRAFMAGELGAARLYVAWTGRWMTHLFKLPLPRIIVLLEARDAKKQR